MFHLEDGSERRAARAAWGWAERGRMWVAAVGALCASMAIASAAQGGPGGSCAPGWAPTFGGLPGVDGPVQALAVFDAGTGPALHVGGSFAAAGGREVANVARWDGASWSSTSTGLGPGGLPVVLAFALHDDGGGPALFAAGWNPAAGPTAGYVARWNGVTWSMLGAMDSFVHALASWDDGTGPALYAGGSFTLVGGTMAHGVAKWDGLSWKPLGAGVGGFSASVRALAVHDEGAGPALFAAGEFGTAGGANARQIARWNGSAWSALGSGLDGAVHALLSHDDGSGVGRSLFAAGDFTLAGGGRAGRIARWNGGAWSALGDGLNGSVRALCAFDDGSGHGSELCAAGALTSGGTTVGGYVARWRGGAWSQLCAADSAVHALAGFGGALHAAGAFHAAGGSSVGRIARWSQGTWEPLGSGLTGSVLALARYVESGSSRASLFASGALLGAGGANASRIAAWDGTSWSALGEGADDNVHALLLHDDGSGMGRALYAGGRFRVAGGVVVRQIARWNGSAWSALGTGVGGPTPMVNALAARERSGAASAELFAAGRFTSAGGVGVLNIARWSGGSWSALGSGLNQDVKALALHDDGSGLALFAGGRFTTAGGHSALRVAKWNGVAWSAVGAGMNAEVSALLSHPGNGSGPRLYAGGSFTQAGGVAASCVAQWDGSAWAPLGNGLDGPVAALALYDDGGGGGPALYAAGSFTSIGGLSARRIARWDGSAWSVLGAGLGGAVSALLVHDDGSGAGPFLVAGGGFASSPGSDSFVARWGGCAPADPGTAYCFGDGSGTACPCGNAGAPGAGCANSTGLGARLGATGSSSALVDDLRLLGSQLRPGQPALLFAGTNAPGAGNGIHFGDGLRCAGGASARLGVRFADGAGALAFGPGLAERGAFAAGDTRRFQLWYRDPGASPCGSAFNLSNGHELRFTP